MADTHDARQGFLRYNCAEEGRSAFAPFSSSGLSRATLFSPMLTAAFIVLAGAALLGAGLAVAHLRSKAAAPVAWWLGALHALTGLGGLGLLALALRGPVRGIGQGTELFGMIAAALIALAALAAGGMLARRLRNRPPGALLGLHAGLAVSGVVILAAYYLA